MSPKVAMTSPAYEIPPTDAIRNRLAQAVREADVLRRLLKVAEYAERQLATVDDRDKEVDDDGR